MSRVSRYQGVFVINGLDDRQRSPSVAPSLLNETSRREPLSESPMSLVLGLHTSGQALFPSSRMSEGTVCTSPTFLSWGDVLRSSSITSVITRKPCYHVRGLVSRFRAHCLVFTENLIWMEPHREGERWNAWSSAKFTTSLCGSL